MGVVESVRGLMWARKRQPDEVATACSSSALTIIKRRLDRETVDFDGEYFRAKGARLFLDHRRRPPVYMSAFGPQAAEIAGRLADGLWTLADPQKAPAVIAPYRRAAEQAGREPGEIVPQGMASWARASGRAPSSMRTIRIDGDRRGAERLFELFPAPGS